MDKGRLYRVDHLTRPGSHYDCFDVVLSECSTSLSCGLSFDMKLSSCVCIEQIQCPRYSL